MQELSIKQIVSMSSFISIGRTVIRKLCEPFDTLWRKNHYRKLDALLKSVHLLSTNVDEINKVGVGLLIIQTVCLIRFCIILSTNDATQFEKLGFYLGTLGRVQGKILIYIYLVGAASGCLLQHGFYLNVHCRNMNFWTDQQPFATLNNTSVDSKIRYDLKLNRKPYQKLRNHIKWTHSLIHIVSTVFLISMVPIYTKALFMALYEKPHSYLNYLAGYMMEVVILPLFVNSALVLIGIWYLSTLYLKYGIEQSDDYLKLIIKIIPTDVERYVISRMVEKFVVEFSDIDQKVQSYNKFARFLAVNVVYVFVPYLASLVFIIYNIVAKAT